MFPIILRWSTFSKCTILGNKRQGKLELQVLHPCLMGSLYWRRDGTFSRDGMFSGTGRFLERDVFRDGTFSRDGMVSGTGHFPGWDGIYINVQRHIYLSYLSRSVYMERLFARTFSRDGTFSGTGRHIYQRHIYSQRSTAYISLIFITFRFYGKIVCRDVFRRVPAKRDPGSLNRDPGNSGTIFIM